MPRETGESWKSEISRIDKRDLGRGKDIAILGNDIGQIIMLHCVHLQICNKKFHHFVQLENFCAPIKKKWGKKEINV